GVPVLAKGKWSNPQIYADLPDILSNPAAALGKLRAGDKGLGGMLGGSGAKDWMKGLDDLIGGGKGGGGGFGGRLKQVQIPRGLPRAKQDASFSARADRGDPVAL